MSRLSLSGKSSPFGNPKPQNQLATIAIAPGGSKLTAAPPTTTPREDKSLQNTEDGDAKEKHKDSWVDVAKRNRTKQRLNLIFIPPDEVEGRKVVRYCSNDVILNVNRWKSAAFGYVLGLNPSVGVVENFAKNHWKQFGVETVFRVKNGIFLFQFESDEKRDEMMEEGPWLLAKRPWILEKWTPDSKLERKEIKSVPVWIRFPNLSLQFWNPEMLSKIGSHLGNPKFADTATTAMEKLAFARICVEVSADMELPPFVPLVDEKNREFQQKVIYEWLPQRCEHCKVFGHESVRCRLHKSAAEDSQIEEGFVRVQHKHKRQWVEKEKIAKIVEIEKQVEMQNSFELLVDDVEDKQEELADVEDSKNSTQELTTDQPKTKADESMGMNKENNKGIQVDGVVVQQLSQGAGPTQSVGKRGQRSLAQILKSSGSVKEKGESG